MRARAVLFGALVLLGLLLVGLPAAGGPVIGSPIANTPPIAPLVVPPCNCSDDGPRWRTTLATGRPMTLMRGRTYTVASPVPLPSNAEVHLAGATINSAATASCTVDGVITTWASTLCTVISGGTATTLSGDATAGATSFSLTSATGCVAGGYVTLLAPTSPAPQAGQTVPIASVSGSTVTIGNGRSLSVPYPAAATNVYCGATVPSNVRIYGEGATLTVTTRGQTRGIQLQGCLGCKLTDLTVTGWPRTAFSYDLGGYRSEVTGLVVDTKVLTVSGAVSGTGGVVRLTVDTTSGLRTGDDITVQGVGGCTEANVGATATVVDGTHLELQGVTFVHTYTSGGQVFVDEEAVMSESCESCTFDVKVRGAAVGLHVFAAVRGTYKADVGAPCNVGVVADDNRAFGSTGATLDTPSIVGCGADGLRILDASPVSGLSPGWHVKGGSIVSNAVQGVYIATDVSGTPDQLQIDGVTVSNNGSNGLHLVNVGAATLRGLHVMSNGGSGIAIDSGAATVEVADSVIGANTSTGVYVSGGVLANTHRLAELDISGGAYGVQTAGSGTYSILATGVKIKNTGATPYGWWIGHPGRVEISGGRVDFTGASGSGIGYAFNNGTGGVVTLLGTSFLGTGANSYGSFQAGGYAYCLGGCDAGGVTVYPGWGTTGTQPFPSTTPNLHSVFPPQAIAAALALLARMRRRKGAANDNDNERREAA